MKVSSFFLATLFLEAFQPQLYFVNKGRKLIALQLFVNDTQSFHLGPYFSSSFSGPEAKPFFTKFS
jgi:hypothetical protein